MRAILYWCAIATIAATFGFAAYVSIVYIAADTAPPAAMWLSAAIVIFGAALILWGLS